MESGAVKPAAVRTSWRVRPVGRGAGRFPGDGRGGCRRWRGDGVAEEAGADAADAEAGGFFGGEHEEFDGARGGEAGLFEGAHGFEAAEDADGAVVHAGVGDGVGVGAGADGGEVGVGAGEADEGVADGVDAEGEACGFGEGGDVGAGFEVAGGEDDAGDGGSGRGEGGVGGGRAVGEGGEVVELAEEAVGVDGEGHECLLDSFQFVVRIVHLNREMVVLVENDVCSWIGELTASVCQFKGIDC